VRNSTLVGLVAFAALAGCGTQAEAADVAGKSHAAAAPNAEVGKTASAHIEKGVASVYSDRLDTRKTASGQAYDRDALTAAHKSLPFGTKVKVTNRRNGSSVIVTINDRGPAVEDRILDLSARAGEALGIGDDGLANVTVEIVRKAPAAERRGK
jgi:peptidoglycan lytic transglycosylase